MSQHAFLAFSAADRWVRCALAPTLEAAYPQLEESPESMEGTAAHWVVQMFLQGTPVALGMQAPNGIAVTEEMLEAAELVRDDIVRTLGPNWAQMLIVERRVAAPRIHPTHCWGTPDYRAWAQMANGGWCLYVWELKYGFGVVDVFENWQMLCQVEASLEEAGIDGLMDQHVVVDMRVIQPRAPHRDGPVRPAPRTTAAALRPFFNQLTNAAGAATQPNPKATPTPEGCKNCKGRHACEALQRAAFSAAEKAQQLGAYELSPHALGLELKTLETAAALLAARVSGLKQQAESTIRAGTGVPFWGLDSIPGKLAWTKPDAEVFALGDMLGLELRKAPAPITPTQAKDAAKRAKLPPEVFAAFAERPSGAVKLVPDDGKKWRLIFGST